ncbi:2-dehydropantoate 2-reductase [Nitrospirillum iridis]|uniref:2-dehydropantoate 2-reductase n=1 Tax=Nitrospirillum iridis TaxID=765888 RepID=A0A7X0EGB5_9PROT|nr:2-dehydropantoate 2-reductase [Nitrospirillum iridis]MBB6253951.1 2-dehydropantoate 2-reductase [Nitrospirillum iridis]
MTMRVLVLGAGATGGFYGGHLMMAGENVTFLVRPKRHAQLMENGLSVISPVGNITLPAQAVTRVSKPFDLILLSCKAYDLDAAIETIRPAVGPDTRILPVLNGLNHLERLDAAFGVERVMGGLCHLTITMDPDGTIRHLNAFNRLTFGARHPVQAPVADTLAQGYAKTPLTVVNSADIVHDMWEKFYFLATLAGATTLMRAPIGAILKAPDGLAFINGLLDECTRVATAAGHPPSAERDAESRYHLNKEDSALSASMMRDIEKAGPTEGEHIVGDLLRRGREFGLDLPLLTLAATHLRAYEARRGAS